jgi:hypothetical protein
MKWLAALLLVMLVACATDRNPEIRDPDFCTEDAQCVRQPSCCDCGVGTWVNQEYQSETPDCTQVCKCATVRATGVCRDNRCVGEPV